MNSVLQFESIGVIAIVVLVILTWLSIWSWSVIFKKYFMIKEIEKQEDIVIKYIEKGGKTDDILSYSDHLLYSPTAMFFKDSRYKDIGMYIEGVRVKLSKGLTLLASIGANAPFIGLFGTVVGIMNAFSKIGTSGSTNITVIAPGISEALITTAAGLFVAIPAVFAYNVARRKTDDILVRTEATLQYISKRDSAKRND